VLHRLDATPTGKDQGRAPLTAFKLESFDGRTLVTADKEVTLPLVGRDDNPSRLAIVKADALK
jgi:hypothetical protein